MACLSHSPAAACIHIAASASLLVPKISSKQPTNPPSLQEFAVPTPFRCITGNSQRHIPIFRQKNSQRLKYRLGNIICSAKDEGQETELVTFLGKGGVGKTSAAILLAKSYAAAGKKTCLAVQSPDRSADMLLGCSIGSSVTEIDGSNLSCVRLETTKLLLEPLAELKKADARLGLSQGALDEVVGEELSVLPGMDSTLAVAVIEKLARPAGGLLARMGATSAKFDTVIFDGPSSSELLRILGAAERTRWYLRRARAALEKTDGGRVALPSIGRLLENLVSPEGAGKGAAARGGGWSAGGGPPASNTAEAWEAVDKAFALATTTFLDRARFACFVVAREDDMLSQHSALRLWGGAMQAGLVVSGALLLPASGVAFSDGPSKRFADDFRPLPVALLPRFDGVPGSVDWASMAAAFKEQASAPDFLSAEKRKAWATAPPPPVSINATARTVSLFLPGFDKTEVKLSQWRAGSELLVEVGDQRRSILLPVGMRGKVTGAKFADRVLTVTIRKS